MLQEFTPGHLHLALAKVCLSLARTSLGTSSRKYVRLVHRLDVHATRSAFSGLI